MSVRSYKPEPIWHGSDNRAMRETCLNCKRVACNFGTCPEIEKQAYLQRVGGNAAKLYTMDGESHPLSFWAQMYGLTPSALRCRLAKFEGDLKKAVEHKPKPPAGKKYTCFGQTYTIGEWAILCDISEAGLRYRIARGQPLEVAFFEAKERLKGGKEHV